jgi:rfaE bifunctional protein kinase chain/domain
MVRIDREDVLPDDPALAAKLRENVRRAAAGASVLVLSDYGYGSSRPEWIAAAREANPAIRVLVDSRFRLSDYAGADAATPNEEELERAAGETLDDSEERFEGAGRALLARLSSPALLVTRGSRGMALFRPERPTLSIPVSGTAQVADVTGAGDTVMATFALALAAGATEPEAALLSNFAGGIVVMKMGTATVTPAELREAVESSFSPTAPSISCTSVMCATSRPPGAKATTSSSASTPTRRSVGSRGTDARSSPRRSGRRSSRRSGASTRSSSSTNRRPRT